MLPANTEGRRQYALPLLLQLWDVPLDGAGDGNAEDEDLKAEMMANCDSAGEIAGMFRFAQHVTLCPDPAGGADLDDLSCDLASLIDETAPNGAHGAQSTTWQSTRPWPWTCPSAARYSHAQSGRGRDGLPMPVFGVWRRDGPSLAEQHQDGHEEFHDSLEHGRGVGRDPFHLRTPSL